MIGLTLQNRAYGIFSAAGEN